MKKNLLLLRDSLARPKRRFLNIWQLFQNVKVGLSNYATKRDIENISHIDTSSFALKTNLANLKTEVDKLDVDKLAPVPTDLSKLSNVVKNDVVKKLYIIN